MDRVVCVGGAVADLKLTLRASAVLETSNPAVSGTAWGGVARNVAENLAVLGVPVALVSRVGSDPTGEALRAHLTGVGVDVQHLATDSGAETARYVAVLEPFGDLVLGVAAMDILDGLTTDDLDAAWPGRPGAWVFCDANLPTTLLRRAIARAAADGVPLALDAVSTPKVTRFPADLRGVTLISLNIDEARAWLAAHGRPDPVDETGLAEAVRRAGARTVLLTLGERGVLVAQEGRVELVLSPPATPVDVTGAGDALIAGTLAALLAGADILDAVALGVERAARTVESPHSVLPRLEA
ncbi:carbohydrate kinase family protein [Spongisporangium articulatum]|uniref:Carbohydrate kinase family protein n=1 Tax=Spongisporangium articulatum TaxID=3362603 RepID=A0ABW8AMP1_9ACTN